VPPSLPPVSLTSPWGSKPTEGPRSSRATTGLLWRKSPGSSLPLPRVRRSLLCGSSASSWAPGTERATGRPGSVLLPHELGRYRGAGLRRARLWRAVSWHGSPRSPRNPAATRATGSGPLLVSTCCVLLTTPWRCLARLQQGRFRSGQEACVEWTGSSGPAESRRWT
jgi:hypothetical protein